MSESVSPALAAGAISPPRAGGLGSKRQSLWRQSTWFAVISAGAYAFSLLKTLVVTHLFGTSAAMDAYTLAVLIPNLFGALVAGSANAGLVPALAMAESQGTEERKRTFRSLMWIAGWIGVGGSVLLALTAPTVVAVLGAGVDPARRTLAAALLRIVSGMVCFNAVYALASAELLSRRRFAITAAAPVISIVVSLVIILRFADRGIYVLAYGLLAGTAVQALVVALAALKANRTVGRMPIGSPLVRHALRAQVPLLLASGIGVLNVSVDQWIAGFLPAGAVSALSYGSTINGIVVQCIVMSLGWVALPEFASLYADRRMPALLERVRDCIRGVVLIAAPLPFLILALGDTAIRITFQHGAFNAASTHLVYVVWSGYSLGLVPFAIGMIGVRMANAVHAQKALAWIGGVMLPANAALDYVFMRRFGVFGISLSTSFVYLLSTALVMFVLRRRMGVPILDARTRRHLGRTFAVALLSALIFLPLGHLLRASTPAMVLAALGGIALLLLLYSKLGLLHFTSPSVPAEL